MDNQDDTILPVEPEILRRIRQYFVNGAGAAQIGWGLPDDLERCKQVLRQESDKISPNAVPKYIISNLACFLHKAATGRYPYQDDGTN